MPEDGKSRSLGEATDVLQGYEPYCLADPLFYDAPTRTRGDDVDFAGATQALPPGWTRTPLDDWLVYLPREAKLPGQGWKVHVSACLHNAEAVLEAVIAYCLERGLPFKFIRSRQLLLLRNGKYADRGSSGKFITIYPSDEQELEAVLTELGSTLAGQPGPYVLSDLRWAEGPLYVRYGGFDERYCRSSSGEWELAIVDNNGDLVPDERGPTFALPAWVALPGFLAPHLEARSRATADEFPYTIESALHFSNGGGLYSGSDNLTGEPVILKEARPYAGLDRDGTDAVARLRHEAAVLRRLGGLAVPAVRDELTVDGHRFLVEEYVDGTALTSAIVDRYPLTEHGGEPAVHEYTTWALDMCRKVEEAVAAIHGRGIVICDLHPSNVLVTPDDEVVLLDFETARPVDEARRPTLADPGFVAPADRRGFDIDRYALACLRLFAFLPLTHLLLIDRDKAEDHANEISRLFPVPREFLDDAVRVIRGAGTEVRTACSRPELSLGPDAEGWERARQAMTAAILSSATPQRNDRLFPGDIKQFESGGLNVAYGAAGVLYALAVTGTTSMPEHEQWLIERALTPEPGTRPGFYDGLHGVAYVLHAIGRDAEARKVLELCSRELDGSWDRLGLDLFGGLAGIGLNLLHFGAVQGDSLLSDGAHEVARRVADRLGSEEAVGETSGGDEPYAGLMRGSSGPALLFLRMHEASGDAAYLDLALTALRQDLRRCVLRADGALEVNEDWRTMPYLCDGSAGIAMVLEEYLRYRPDEALRGQLAALWKAAEAVFYAEPGLFYGRAGMILALSRDRTPASPRPGPLVEAHIRRLAWHALPYCGGIAFPGEELLRLSMDLGSGTAGVLLAMGAALHDSPVHLPFLEPRGGTSIPGGDLPDVATTERR